MAFLRTALLFLLLLPGAAFSAELGMANLSLIRGDVQIYSDDTRGWVAASINMPLLEGDRLWIPDGARAEVHIQGGVYIRLDSATSFDILALQEESYQFYLNGGHVYINNRRGGIDHIQIDTPESSIGCYDNSLVMIDVADSTTTDVSVLKGYAAAETRNGKSGVEAGNELHIGSDMAAELSPLAPPDTWENWNRERDKRLAAGNRSLRYIPEELDDYAYQLDDYGKWVYVTDYGYCWTPLKVSVDWTPYRAGRWCWVRGDYVWISYEPWGWVPHHYGRWAFVANFGWCWVPPRAGGVYWAPGYVGWVHTPDHVAWVPLAPGEIYYGRGHYGPGSVNITNIAINRTVVQNFRNVNVRNAVTVVNQSTFTTGRKEMVRTRENPFRAANFEPGPPTVTPTRETSMPVIKKIPRSSRPPERVQRVTVDELKRERALVREEKGSVFKPGRPGAEMPVSKRSDPPRTMSREERPANPAVKPAPRGQAAPRRDRKPPAVQPEMTKDRPAVVQPETTKSHPAAAQPDTTKSHPAAAQPDTTKVRPTAAQPDTTKVRPAAAQPETTKSRPPSAPGESIPPAQRPHSVVPRKAPDQIRGGPPAKMQREPIWQEPSPAGKAGAQRQTPVTQPRPPQVPPRVEAPPQPPRPQTAPGAGAPQQQRPQQASPQGEKMGPAPTPREPADRGGKPPEKEQKKLNE